jgi:predicted SnoaL-like aldol condensation-catalyzing enzyme
LSARFIEEFINERNMEVGKELLSSDYVGHQAPEKEYSKDRLMGFVGEVVPESFPDTHDTILQFVGEGDLVVVRTSRSLTFTRDLGNAPATKKHGSYQMCSISSDCGRDDSRAVAGF